MPVVVALAIRAIIQALVTTGILAAAERFILPLVNRAIQEVAELFGLSEEDARDIVANEFLQIAEQAGILALTIRTKLPVRIAERLGFTTKGFTKRTLSSKAAAAAKGKTASGIILDPKAPATIEKIAQGAAAARGVSVDKALKVATILIATTGIPIQMGILLVNTLDLGAWNTSAYQGYFQKIFAFFGVEADKDYVKSRVLSTDQFNKVFATYQNLGATEINDPYKNARVPFTRDNMVPLLDKLAAAIIAEKGSVKTKELFAALTALVIFKEQGEPTPKGIPGVAVVSAAATPPAKIFTGVITQGVLGEGTPFVAQEDDLIDSDEDLRAAVQNNLVPFMQALPMRVVWEVKTQTSVVGKDGIRRFGGTQRIVSGTNKDGTPRYKNVTNRFAVLDIYVFTARNVRSKIDTIILGPTDAGRFAPSRDAVIKIEGELRNNIFTTDIRDVSAVQTSVPVTIVPPEQPASKITQRGQELLRLVKDNPSAFFNDVDKLIDAYTQSRLERDYRSLLKEINGKAALLKAEGIAPEDVQEFVNRESAAINALPPTTAGLLRPGEATPQILDKEAILNEYGFTISKSARAVFSFGDINREQALTAQNLTGFYAAARLPLPPIAERGDMYEKLGLGPAPFYYGTATQNIKLLGALKALL